MALEAIALADVLPRRKDLEVRWHMEAANHSATQGDNVVDVPAPAGRVHPGTFGIDGGNGFAIGPSRRLLELDRTSPRALHRVLTMVPGAEHSRRVMPDFRRVGCITKLEAAQMDRPSIFLHAFAAALHRVAPSLTREGTCSLANFGHRSNRAQALPSQIASTLKSIGISNG